MVIPLLVGIMAAVFFMTWVMGNQQRLRMANRYMVWHVARGGNWMSEEEVNPAFLMNRARDVEILEFRGSQWGANFDTSNMNPHHLEPTDQAMTDLAELAETETIWAGPFAVEILIRNNEFELPRGVMGRLNVRFPSNVGPWQAFLDKPFREWSVREGPEWHRLQSEINNGIAATRLLEIDRRLDQVPDQGAELAEVFRWMYLDEWDVSGD